jgi:hypothetical protein
MIMARAGARVGAMFRVSVSWLALLGRAEPQGRGGIYAREIWEI